jgi:GTPase SAR1 family protein
MSYLDRLVGNARRYLRDEFPPFRILVIGKRNSGKTTILNKLCGGTVPIVRDKHGNEVSFG